MALAYGGVATCAERAATALCTSQLFGAVQKTQTFLGALAQNPLCSGLLIQRCRRRMEKFGGISVSLNSARKEKVLLSSLPTRRVVQHALKSDWRMLSLCLHHDHQRMAKEQAGSAIMPGIVWASEWFAVHWCIGRFRAKHFRRSSK